MTTLLAASLLAYVTVPHIDMREKPESNATICSDAIYSEKIEVLEEQDSWVRIKTTVDGYEGWIPKEYHCEGGVKRVYCQRQDEFLADPQAIEARVNRLRAHLYGVKDTEQGPILELPFESRLQVLDQTDARWLKVRLVDDREAYIQRGDVSIRSSAQSLSLDEVCTLALQFQNLPYRWGGRSSVGGYDCSGFVQMLHRQMNIFIPRDSKDQMKWDGFISVAVDINELKKGDLIFFGLAEDKIRHVGLYLGDGSFIHSTVQENKPYIHVSKLSDPDWNGQGRFVYSTARRLK